MSGGLSLIGWLCAIAANGWLLFVVASRMSAGRLLRLAALTVIATPICFVAIALAIAAIGAHPGESVGSRLVSALLTIEVLAMLTFINAVFHGMVDSVINFHKQYNAANLNRFPINVLIRYRDRLKIFATTVWFAGGALMLYGVWFDTHL